MSFKDPLRALRRWASSLVELPWRAGFLAAGRLAPSRALLWSTTGSERVLVIAPHPDDEAIACSGTILRHREAGDRVIVVVATDGRQSRAVASRHEMAAVRRREAMDAARRLGIDELAWLGLPEGDWTVPALQSLLGGAIRRHAPTVIYAPSRIDFHPEHLAVAHALARALEAIAHEQSPKPRVRVYQVQVPLTRILTNVVADISGVLAQSDAVLQAYESQMGSLECAHRRRHYSALSHGGTGAVEEFWELTAERYAELHTAPPASWSGRFRGLRRFAWTDPLAYLMGNAQRRRLRLLAGRTP